MFSYYRRSVFLTQAGLIAALYAALTLALPMASFGAVQCRLSEMLTILPVFTPAAIPGLAVGCAVSNLAGLAVNPAGAWDILIGSLTTLAAACLTRRLSRYTVKGLPVAATLPPVILNAVVLGLEFTIAELHGLSWPLLGANMALVAGGQLIACTVGGLALFAALARSTAGRRLFGGPQP